MNLYDIILAGKVNGGGGGGAFGHLYANKNGYYNPADDGVDYFIDATVAVPLIEKQITAPNLASLTIPPGIAYTALFQFSLTGLTVRFPVIIDDGVIVGGWIASDGSSGVVASMSYTQGVQGVTLSYGAQIENGTVTDMTPYANYLTDIKLFWRVPEEQS